MKQGFAAHVERRVIGFLDDVFGAGPLQLIVVNLVVSTHQHLEPRIFTFEVFHQIDYSVAIVDRNHEQIDPGDTGGCEQIMTRCVAEKTADIELSHVINLLRIVIQDDRLNPIGDQQAIDNLPETSNAGDQHASVFVDDIVFTIFRNAFVTRH